MKIPFITIRDSAGTVIKREKSTRRPLSQMIDVDKIPLINAQVSRLWITSLMKSK